MTQFVRLLGEPDKGQALADVCRNLRNGAADARGFEVAASSFDAVPGKPFGYWVGEDARRVFLRHPPFLNEARWPSIGASTKDDFRYLRAFWEVDTENVAASRPATEHQAWVLFSKGGAYSKFYAPIYLAINWMNDGRVLKADISEYRGSRGWGYQWSAAPNGHDFYFHPGLTWPRRTQGGLSMRAMPAGCIFADKGPAAFVADDVPEELLALLAMVNSRPFGLLVSLQMAFGSYELGVIQKTPIPTLTQQQRDHLSQLARRAWSLKRVLDSITETSHAFSLPSALRARLGIFAPLSIEAELAEIQTEIDKIAVDLYGLLDAGRIAAAQPENGETADSTEGSTEDTDDDVETDLPVASVSGLLSWTLGVAFGRFDWRLATGERAAPPEPEPFDPLPARSPGMLVDGAIPFHAHAGILVDDPGHGHDLVHLVEDVLARVDMPVQDDLRRWLQRDFFPFHLQRYSKSRRKAPIYWPLATLSGSYTLWLYYPSLSSQTLYSAINDFVEPKLAQLAGDLAVLRGMGSARSRDDEKRLEACESLELELVEFRDQLLKIASTYKPSHDDGVQISAAPLWPLFRYKPWQKVLKDTWTKLEKGEYDWAHLARNYWPDRVREKCKSDKSLAITHRLEELYVEPSTKPTKSRGKPTAAVDVS